MCDPLDDTDAGYCEKFKLEIKLKSLITSVTVQDQNNVSYVRVQYIENLIKELECSI